MKNALTLTTSKVLSFVKIQINLVFRSLNRTFADAMSDKRQGLSATEVAMSRLEHGENVLTPPRRQSMWRLYLEKYQDPMIRILLVAAVVSLVLSFVKNDYIETIGIIAAVILATTVGFYFERDAARKFDVLTQLGEEQRVKVIRSLTPNPSPTGEGSQCQVMEIPRKEVVVGDIVIVETGDEVPADGKLFEATDLQVDESSLTGEMLTTKSLDHQKVSAYPSDQLLRSSMVMNGTGRYVVTAVGDETEIGHVARQATEITGVKTPLNLQLERLAKLISKVGSGVSIAAFVVFLVHDVLTQPLWHTTDYVGMIEVVLKYFMMAVTLIVMAEELDAGDAADEDPDRAVGEFERLHDACEHAGGDDALVVQHDRGGLRIERPALDELAHGFVVGHFGEERQHAVAGGRGLHESDRAGVVQDQRSQGVGEHYDAAENERGRRDDAGLG